MTVFDFADALTPLIEATMFFMLFDAFLKRREYLSDWCYGIGIVGLSVFIALVNHFFLLTIWNALGFVVGSLLFSFSYEGSLAQRLLSCFFGVLIIAVTELVVLFLLTSLFSIEVDGTVTIQEYRFLGTMASKLLGLAICNGIRVKRTDLSHQSKKAYWALFIVMLSGNLMAAFLIFRLTYELDTTTFNIPAAIASLVLFFSTFFALYLYERLERQSEEIRTQEQYEQQLQDQLIHLDALLIQQDTLRKFKHEVRNQLLALDAYFTSGDMEGGARHVASLMQRVAHVAPSFDTGNTALDAVLSSKKSVAEHKGIDFDINLRIAEKLNADPVDLCMILGNALDNAIEACEKLQTGEKHIILDLRQQGNILFCQIANTALPPHDPSLSTSKPDKENHGYGLANLTAALRKYDGEPSITWENDWFTLSWMMFIKK